MADPKAVSEAALYFLSVLRPFMPPTPLKFSLGVSLWVLPKAAPKAALSFSHILSVFSLRLSLSLPPTLP